MKKRLAEVKQKVSKRRKLAEQQSGGLQCGGQDDHQPQRDTCDAPEVSTEFNDHPLKGDSNRFAGMTVSDLLFVEVFAGSARLSKTAKEFGFQVLPIDKTAGRATQIFIAQYDLADPDALQALLELLHNEKHRVVAVHLAPACGTASKAREKSLLSLQHRASRYLCR